MHMTLFKPRVRTVTLVEAAIGAGARDPGCRDGARHFWTDLRGRDALPGASLRWHPMPESARADGDGALATIARANTHLANATETLTALDRRFIAIGGDHSCGIGTWSGAARALRRHGPLGLVWIDAHLDMHVPESTHSGFINGMPVAALLGHGARSLTGLAGDAPAIDPRHICVVGVRSFEPEEMALAERLGVRVVRMEEVARRSLADVLGEARAIASDGTAGYGVSLDLDGLDPRDTPAVATPEPGGIRAADLLRHWGTLTGGACVGAEIAEFNPYRAGALETAQWMRRLVAAAFESEVTP